MKIFRKILKNKLFYLVLLLGVFLTPILKFTLHAQEVYDNDFNLANPDIANKEYLGEGVYRLYNGEGITIDYNVYNGEYTINGTTTDSIGYAITNYIFEQNDYVLTFYGVTGSKGDGYDSISLYSSTGNPDDSPKIILPNTSSGLITDISNYTVYGGMRRLNFYTNANITYNNYTFKLQLEKGDTATPYKLPIQALYDHAYNDGFGDGYESGEIEGYYVGADDGYESGKIDGYNDGFGDGYESGKIDGYELGENDGYNQAREDYGYYDEESEKWVKVDERYQDIYDEGYQDGASDTNDYYDDNGLFIPQTIPKAHLVVDFDLRYGEPYFYLQDFSGDYDPGYFGFQHNKWLEKAFDWAYSTEYDFLAINDLYMLKYKSDEVIYKYFFYKYDTDSIYFYNDDGTLLKIVERVDFDYYVYEVPELSQEEQARIDNAYNKGMRDYGYYDSESEEYLTATEYGEIRYNQGVISTRDKAYSDGFLVAMWYSHQHGFDWVRATYYELIAERPILHNASDITSFAYQEGYDKGFDYGDRVGYDRGYDYGLDVGLDVGYDRGYDDGLDDGYDEGYSIGIETTTEVIYDEIYNKGYKDGQKTGMNNKFYTGLEKWIVPALIVVLFFGLLMLFPKNKED